MRFFARARARFAYPDLSVDRSTSSAYRNESRSKRNGSRGPLAWHRVPPALAQSFCSGPPRGRVPTPNSHLGIWRVTGLQRLGHRRLTQAGVVALTTVVTSLGFPEVRSHAAVNTERLDPPADDQHVELFAQAMPQLERGQVRVYGPFNNCTNGVPSGFSASTDFESGEFSRRCDSGLSRQKIMTPHDETKGDVSIFRSFNASPNQRYKVTAICKIKRAKSDFRGRAKIAAWGGGSQLNEWFVDLTDKGGPFVKISRETPMTSRGTTSIRVNFRAHAHTKSASGVAVLRELRFKRIR
jgi:hypothetical protein